MARQIPVLVSPNAAERLSMSEDLFMEYLQDMSEIEPASVNLALPKGFEDFAQAVQRDIR